MREMVMVCSWSVVWSGLSPGEPGPPQQAGNLTGSVLARGTLRGQTARAREDPGPHAVAQAAGGREAGPYAGARPAEVVGAVVELPGLAGAEAVELDLAVGHQRVADGVQDRKRGLAGGVHGLPGGPCRLPDQLREGEIVHDRVSLILCRAVYLYGSGELHLVKPTGP